MKKTLAALTLLSLFTPSAMGRLTSVGYDKKLYTSDFMIGDVVVAVIFPESDGSKDKKTESWSEERKSQALSKIMAGLDWWSRQNPRSPLSFTFITKTISTKYEPITRPYSDEAYWIPDVLGKIGYTGTRFEVARNYVNDLRNEYNADWGFIIFVIDSQNDTNGKFADGLFAYAYLGGPFLVMTYDNNGYGIGNMDVVVAHETGHVFHALDQYAGASSPNDYSRGYFPTKNSNHAYSSQASEPNSIMRGGIRWGLDNPTRTMIGWRDNDDNGHDDILDQSPKITMNSQSVAGAPHGATSFSGVASVSVLPRQSNSLGWGLTLDTVANVEYRLANGDWTDANPVDGTFDGASENFHIIILPSAAPGAKTITAQDVDVRVVTNYATKTGNSDGGGLAGVPTTLDGAHPFPNPFKPNSGIGHTHVTFGDLTPGSHVHIFTIAGEPVFDAKVPSPATSTQWLGVDNDGKDVASGVYFYLITDEEGHKKEGKLAVIR